MRYDFIEPYYEPEIVCRHCEEKEKIIDVAKEYLESIVKILYSSQEIDLLKIQDDLIEICHSFGVEIPKNELRITRL